MRAVEGFLRRRIASALPIGFATLPDTGEQLRFVGEPTRMRFVADLPDYLGRGGPHLHDVELFADGDSSRLAVSISLVAVAWATTHQNPDTQRTLYSAMYETILRHSSVSQPTPPPQRRLK